MDQQGTCAQSQTAWCLEIKFAEMQEPNSYVWHSIWCLSHPEKNRILLYIYIYSFFSKVFKINDEIPWNMSKSNCIPTTAALTVRETLYDANVTSPSTKSAFTSEETTLHWPMLQESESIIQINRNLPVSRCPMEFCKSEWNFHRWIWHAITRNFLDFLDSTLMLRNFDPPTLDDNITAAASHA